MRKIETYQFKHKLRREANLPDLEQIKHSWEKLRLENRRGKKVVTIKGKQNKNRRTKIIHRFNEESKAKSVYDVRYRGEYYGKVIR